MMPSYWIALLCMAVSTPLATTTTTTTINQITTITGAPSGRRYHYIPFSLAVNRRDADEACRALGLQLAPIPTVEDLMWVGGHIKDEAWIGSFRGQFVGECVAAFRGGAIAIPRGNCDSNHAVLCG